MQTEFQTVQRVLIVITILESSSARRGGSRCMMTSMKFDSMASLITIPVDCLHKVAML